MFAVNLRAVFKFALQSLSKQWIERFELAAAKVQSADSRCDNQIESFKVV